MTTFNALTEAHTSIKMESVLEDWLYCMAHGNFYRETDLSLLYVAQLLVAETDVGYHILDLSNQTFQFYSYGSIPEAEVEELCRKHQEDFQLEHDLYMASCGIYY